VVDKLGQAVRAAVHIRTASVPPATSTSSCSLSELKPAGQVFLPIGACSSLPSTDDSLMNQVAQLAGLPLVHSENFSISTNNSSSSHSSQAPQKQQQESCLFLRDVLGVKELPQSACFMSFLALCQGPQPGISGDEVLRILQIMAEHFSSSSSSSSSSMQFPAESLVAKALKCNVLLTSSGTFATPQQVTFPTEERDWKLQVRGL